MLCYTYLESDNRHEMYILSLVNKNCAIGCPPWIVFCLKAKLPVPEIISNTAPPYALGFKTTSFILKEMLMIPDYL